MARRIIPALSMALMLLATRIYADQHNKPVDLMSDDFAVFMYLGETYLKQKYKGKEIEIIKQFGIGYTSYSELSYPKVGFIGYELVSDDETLLLKLQLYKDHKGWRVEHVLDNDKIDQANPTHRFDSGRARTDQTAQAQLVAALALQTWLNQEKIIKDVRATSMNCYLSKNLLSASCRGVYGLQVDTGVRCRSKNYLVKKIDGIWKVVKGIRLDQKISYATGELVTAKSAALHCN